MRFIHISDLHLGACPEFQYEWGRKRADELWKTFESAVDACNSSRVELLIISGDMFNHPPIWEECARAAKILARLEAAHTVIIAGDSDYIKDKSGWCEDIWPDRVTVLSGKYLQSVYIEAIDTAVTGCSYHEPEVISPYLDDAKPYEKGSIQILTGHTGDNMHMPADLDALSKKGFNYIALGHSSSHKIFENRKMAYAGALEPVEGSDKGRHGFIIGEINGAKTIVRFVPFASREYVDLKIKMSADINEKQLEENIASVIQNYGKNNIYTISISGKYEPGHPVDENAVKKLGNIIAVNDETVPGYDLAQLIGDHKDDVIGMYVEEFLKGPVGKVQKKALYLGLEALLSETEK